MRCRIRGLDVHCEAFGEGRPILMVHGMGVDHRTMKGCMEPIFSGRSDGWRRVYFDLPGMGKTQGADWIRNSDDMARFVLAVADEVVGDEPFAVAGESYGGYLVRAAVRERPAQALGMLLICPLVVAADERRDVAPCRVLHRDRQLESLDPEVAGLAESFLTNQTPETWQRFRDEMLCGFECGNAEFKSRIRADGAYAFALDVDTMAAPFEKPSLILAGRQDSLVGYRDPWTLLEYYPRASFAVLDMAGHGLQIEQPGLFRALVGEWLDRMESEAT
jgi:pimeloyl-ACP methyl ester carboxylesterase